MTKAPQTWSEARERIAARVGGTADADSWVESALAALWGVGRPDELPRGRRGVALQKLAGVTLALEDGPDPVFALDPRGEIQRVFARYFDGRVPDGPAWRVGPLENDRDSYAEVVDGSEFTEADVRED